MPKFIELGNYIAPAYAGMILAEQGYTVEKWIGDHDPIHDLKHCDSLWAWINHNKTLIKKHPQEIENENDVIGIIDNFRPETLSRWNLQPNVIAKRMGIPWVSLRSEVGDRSFDIIAQARSWMEYSEWVPFYVGDTTAGLWLAFKVLASLEKPDHYVIGQASCMQKMVEGELVIDVPRSKKSIPFDVDDYVFRDGRAIVEYQKQIYCEPVRDRAWKLQNLYHQDGRIVI